MIVFDTNLKAGEATTQYTNFNFNSLVKKENQFLCASEEGLYRIGGTTKMFPSIDASIDVDCYFELATMDFGISNQKRLRAIYVGYEADGDLTLKVSTELSSQQLITIPANTAGQHARKIPISRSLKGRYWTFQIYGSGTIFSIDHICVLPIIIGHGIDRN